MCREKHIEISIFQPGHVFFNESVCSFSTVYFFHSCNYCCEVRSAGCVTLEAWQLGAFGAGLFFVLLHVLQSEQTFFLQAGRGWITNGRQMWQYHGHPCHFTVLALQRARTCLVGGTAGERQVRGHAEMEAFLWKHLLRFLASYRSGHFPAIVIFLKAP